MTSPGRVAAETYIWWQSTRRTAARSRRCSRQTSSHSIPSGSSSATTQSSALYDQYVLANDVSVQATSIIEADTICVVELDGVTPATAEVQRMVDIFTVDEQGQVVRLSIYRR